MEEAFSTCLRDFTGRPGRLLTVRANCGEANEGFWLAELICQTGFSLSVFLCFFFFFLLLFLLFCVSVCECVCECVCVCVCV